MFATQTTCNVFRLLKDAGIPVAFFKQLSTTEFIAEKCQMVPLEVIARRYAVGSYLKRFPNLATTSKKVPFRFHSLVFELFLKTTGKSIKTMAGEEVGQTPIEDPFIHYDEDMEAWNLQDPKLPAWDENASLKLSVHPEDFLPVKELESNVKDVLTAIEEITRKTFLILEGAWAQLGFRLIDFKIEFGITTNGELVIADVIDNDSWRLRTNAWEEVSKQCFRDNAGMEEIGSKYAMVAKLTDAFLLPQQRIVTWKGSKNDLNLEGCGLPSHRSVAFSEIIVSGHKSPSACLDILEVTLGESPEGGVIIAMVGMSNGLGPMLAARTSWPVITVPLTADENAVDVFSSLNVPSQVPLLTIMSRKNAVLAALNILAQKNPYLYMLRQYAIEQLD